MPTETDEALTPTEGARVRLIRRAESPEQVELDVTFFLPERTLEGHATLARQTGEVTLRDLDAAPAWVTTYALALLRQLWTSRREPGAAFPHRVLRWRPEKV
ncbi:MAG: hypothetical protein KF901_15135 [Myxococcales bacterium]|nr:hypothetical protein [Myxococcales bacterium]